MTTDLEKIVCLNKSEYVEALVHNSILIQHKPN